MACAPLSLVAVPITVAPCLPSSSAMAWPMPREAPVTSAICPCSVMSPLPLCECSQCGFERFAIVNGQGLLVGVDALVESGQYLARRAFHVVGDTLFAECLHGLDPAHRRIQLAHQRVLDLGGIAVGSDVC